MTAPCPLPHLASLPAYRAGGTSQAIAQKWGLSADRVIQLASNENPLGPSPQVQKLLTKQRQAGRYPDGEATALRHALARHLDIAADCITVGNGSNELLELIARLYVAPGDEVLYSQYGFAVYPLIAQAIGAHGVEVPAQGYGHDLPAMAAAAGPRTRLVFLANPNNPTGTWFSNKALYDFLSSAAKDMIVVLDEAYCEYAQCHDEYPESLTLLDGFPNLFITRTFSKVWGLAGLRIGYAVSHPDIACGLRRIRQPFNTNAYAQAAATVALQDLQHLWDSLHLNQLGQTQLQQALQHMGLVTHPTAGNFILVQMPGPGHSFAEALAAQGVMVRPVDNYGLSCCLRVSIGTERENEYFIRSLEKILTRHVEAG